MSKDVSGSQHGMAILKPATLEQLVNVHHQYPIDLLKLRDHLVDRQADDEVLRYIQQHIQAVKLRANIIRPVKKFLDSSQDADAHVSHIHAVYIVSKSPLSLKREEMHEILIELFSPLTGYLGRRKSANGCDRIHLLRDMPQIS